MNILILGHEGYVGSALYSHFKKTHQVHGWGRKEGLQNITQEIFRKGHFDLVINCATHMSRDAGPYNCESPSHEINVKSFERLVSILKNFEKTLLIHISSKDVFGFPYTTFDIEKFSDIAFRPKFLIDEKRPVSPVSAYGKSKLISEYIAESLPSCVTIRLSSCYTDFFHTRGHWIPNIIGRLQNGEPVQLTQGGKQFRDVLHVIDLANLIEKIQISSTRRQLIHAGGGSENIISILEFVHLIDKNPRTLNVSGNDFGFAFDNALAKDLYGWTPQIKFRERIEVICENLRVKKEATH